MEPLYTDQWSFCTTHNPAQDSLVQRCKLLGSSALCPFSRIIVAGMDRLKKIFKERESFKPYSILSSLLS